MLPILRRMKRVSVFAIVAVMAQLFISSQAWACQDEVRRELKSARTLLFYAMSTSNSRVELDMAQEHLDEAARLLETCAHRDLRSDLASMQRDLDSRREIASENLNYQLPLYDVMFGHRRDFNTVDDHDEVLIEDLCARILEQPSDVRAQWNVPAVHSWVVFKRPASTELHSVAIEYLSENSGMYVLQLMEYPEAYFAQPDSGQVPFTQEGYAELAEKITAKFGLNQLYLFAFDDKGKIEDLELQYTGVSVLKFDADTQEISQLLYLEDFKSDKRPAFHRSIGFILVYLVLTLAIGLLMSWKKGRPQNLPRSIARLGGASAMFAVAFGVTLAIGRTYGATPVEFASSAHALFSISLYPIVLPILLMMLLHVYRTIVFKGVEMEEHTRSIYWVGLGLIPLPLIAFGLFKSQGASVWIPLFALPVIGAAVFALGKGLRQAKSLRISSTLYWLTICLSGASLMGAAFAAQSFPSDLMGYAPLPLSFVLPIIAYQFILPRRVQQMHAPVSPSNLQKDSLLEHYPGLRKAIEGFCKQGDANIAELTMEAGWGRTTAIEKEIIPLLESDGFSVLRTDLKSSLKNGHSGHIVLAESLRDQNRDVANILHDVTANQSLNITEKAIKFLLSIFTYTDVSSVIGRVRSFNPELIAFELLDYFSNHFSSTVFWWIDDAELLDEEALNFLTTCLNSNQLRQRPDGTPILKIVLTGHHKTIEEAGIAVTSLHAEKINKPDLALQVLQKSFNGHKLSGGLKEDLKELLDPVLEDGSFNLNAVQALVEYLIADGQIECTPLQFSGNEGTLNGEQLEWHATDPIRSLPLDALASALNQIADTSVTFAPETQQLLQIAGSIGVQFDIRVLAQASKLQNHEVLMLLSPAEAAGVIWDDPGEDYVYHFRSRNIKDTYFHELDVQGGEMRQLDRELLRTTGTAAEELFRSNPSDLHLLQCAAQQFWLLRETLRHRDHAIELYEDLAEICDARSMSSLHGLCLWRLSDLTGEALNIFVKLVEHELNSHHKLPESLFSRAVERALGEIGAPSSDGAELCLHLLTSLLRSQRKSEAIYQQLIDQFEALCPAEDCILRTRHAFNNLYFWANLKDADSRTATIAQLEELAASLSSDASPEARSLMGEILNSMAGILVDRHDAPELGLEALNRRLQLLPGCEGLSLDACIDRFVGDDQSMHAEALSPLTWSERKGLAVAVNYAVRALFKLKKLDTLLAQKAWRINAHFLELRGQIIAMSFAAWHQVREGTFDSDLVSNLEDQMRLMKLSALEASATDYLNLLALALIQRTHATNPNVRVSDSTLDSCMSRLLRLLENPDRRLAHRVQFTPPGQDSDLVSLICEHRSALLLHSGQTFFDHAAMQLVEALSLNSGSLRVPTDRVLHLLRHFADISDSERQSLLAERPALSPSDLTSMLCLDGSHFHEAGPVGSLPQLREEISKIMSSRKALVDFYRPAPNGTFEIGLCYDFKETIGKDGIVEVTPDNAHQVQHVRRGDHNRVPTLPSTPPETSWLRFVLKCDMSERTATLITAYAGSYAPPFGNDAFWSRWALVTSATT